MNRYSLLYIIVACCVFAIDGSHAQRRSVNYTPKLEELPRIPLDTIDTADPETKLVLFTNNTFCYYRPTLQEKLDSLQAFNEYWDTTQVFAYKSVALNDLPELIDIKLISDYQDFCAPFVAKVRSKYGRRGRRNHNGVDLPLKTGEPIYATFEGIVRYSPYNSGGFGNLVIIRHSNGLETWYAHMSRRNVSVNDYVKAGDVIGYGGSTGRSTGPHLHFEVRYFDQTFDPERLFAFEEGELKYQTFALERSFFSIYSRETDQLEEYDDFENLASLKDEDGKEASAEDILAYLSEEEKAKREEEYRKSQEVYHTIKSGDMLGSISRRYGVSIDQICRLNNISRNTILQINRRLRIR